jgi:hypothetical protein
MSSTEILEENKEKLLEVIAILNGPESPTGNIATEYNVVQCIEELLELYWESQGKVDEIQDLVGNSW